MHVSVACLSCFADLFLFLGGLDGWYLMPRHTAYASNRDIRPTLQAVTYDQHHHAETRQALTTFGRRQQTKARPYEHNSRS